PRAGVRLAARPGAGGLGHRRGHEGRAGEGQCRGRGLAAERRGDGGGGRALRYWESVASRLISGTPARATEAGQPFFASSAADLNVASSMPGTTPVVARSMRVILQPASCCSKRTCAVVSSDVGGVPARVSPADRAIVKQPAWAAAISSSGL